MESYRYGLAHIGPRAHHMRVVHAKHEQVHELVQHHGFAQLLITGKARLCIHDTRGSWQCMDCSLHSTAWWRRPGPLMRQWHEERSLVGA